MCKICSKLTMKTPQQRQLRRSGVFITKFEQISHTVLTFKYFSYPNIISGVTKKKLEGNISINTFLLDAPF